MDYEVIEILSQYNGNYNQLHNVRFHDKSKECTGDEIQLFDPSNINIQVASCCSTCGEEREE